jgi:hypothetical protein
MTNKEDNKRADISASKQRCIVKYGELGSFRDEFGIRPPTLNCKPHDDFITFADSITPDGYVMSRTIEN